jgi:Family of unknown function (DUF6056)
MTPQAPRLPVPQQAFDRLARRTIWLPILMLAPFVLVIACASPHLDDFCFGSAFIDRGMFGALADYFRTLGGRLSGYSGIMAPFMLQYAAGIDVLSAFRITCALVLGAIVAVGVWGGGRMSPEGSPAVRLLVGGLFAVALVAGGPAPEDVLYWGTGFGPYAIPATATLWLMLCLYDAAARGRTLGGPLVALLVGAGVLGATGSEFSGPILLVVTAGSFAQRCLTQGAPRQTAAHLLIAAAIVLGTLIVVLAPGNAVRFHLYPSDRSLTLRFLIAWPMGAADLATFLFRRLTNPAMIAFLAILAMATATCDRLRPVEPAARLVPWLPLLSAVLGVFGAFVIYEFAIGRYMEARGLEHLHFVLAGGLALTTVAVVRTHAARIAALADRLPSFLTLRNATVAALVLVLITPPFLTAAYVVAWQLATLNRSVADRFERIGSGHLPGASASDRELVLPPIKPAGAFFFGETLDPDPANWANICVAIFAGVRAVRVSEP